MAKMKLKTHRGAKKRFKITATGKVLRMKGLRSHLRRRRSPRVKRQYDKMIPVSAHEVGRVRKAMPYGE